jgi:hypothetical protein
MEDPEVALACPEEDLAVVLVAFREVGHQAAVHQDAAADQNQKEHQQKAVGHNFVDHRIDQEDLQLDTVVVDYIVEVHQADPVVALEDPVPVQPVAASTAVEDLVDLAGVLEVH